MKDVLDLAELQLATLYRFDARGRMTSLNQTDRRPAPWLHLLRSTEGNVWRLHRDLSPELLKRLEELLASEPLASDFEQEPRVAGALRRELGREREIRAEFRGPAFVLPDMPAPDPELLLDREELRAELWSQDQLASSCECARLGADAAEAGVETRAELRGRGLATRVVAGWAHAVQASGRLALYSTGWQNSASQAIAHKLGGRCYGEDFHLD